MIGLTKVASLECAPQGIRVNTVAPGAIDTPMVRGALETVGLTEAEFAPTISLFGRFGQPEEVAQGEPVALLGPASYVTGAVLAVDAGYRRARPAFGEDHKTRWGAAARKPRRPPNAS